VVAGSLLANLLAVSVALFSLQVYDRVIPLSVRRRRCGFWRWASCLAAGDGRHAQDRAGSALLDNTGRRIELSVQDRLMQPPSGHARRPRQTRTPSRKSSARHARFRLGARILYRLDRRHAGRHCLYPDRVPGAGRLDRRQSGLGAGARRRPDGGAGLPDPEADDRALPSLDARRLDPFGANCCTKAVFEHETIATQRGEDRVKPDLGRNWSR
jgi:hypothetical protein